MQWWVLRRKVHASWLIALLSFGFLAGVFLARDIGRSYTLSSWLLVPTLSLVTIMVYRQRIYVIPFLLVGGLLLGLWRGTVAQTDLAQIHVFYDQEVTIQGKVLEDVDIGTGGQLIIRLGNLVVENQAMVGNLWITATSGDMKRSDTITVKGSLKEGFGNFVGTMYRARVNQVIHPQPGDIARVVRDWFAEAIRAVTPEPEASLGIGYLVGQRRALPPDLNESLRIAGLMHVVVASGYNLTILVRFTRRLFVKVSKYLSAVTAGTMILSFIAVTGISPSMSRAGLVAGLSLAAWYYGRRFHPVVLLLFVAALTVLVNPSYAWGDLGWQLSFAAFAGVMILAPLLQRYFFGDKKPGAIRQVMGETFSAQVATAPLLIMSFGQFSNIAVVANMLVLPLIPIAMILTFVTGVGSLILPQLAAELISLPATWLLHYMVGVAEYTANLPWAVTEVALTSSGVAICYGAIGIACLYMIKATSFRLRESNIVE